MRVLLLNDFAAVRGGSDQVAIAEARGLAARGHDVTFWTAVGPVDPSLKDVPRLAVCCLGSQDILQDPQRLRAIRRGIWNGDAAAQLARWINRRDLSGWVGHVHGWSKALSASIFPVLRKAGLDPIITLHDYFAVCPNGTFHDHQRNEPCLRRPLGAACLTTHCDSRAYSHKLWRVLRHSVQKFGAGVPSEVRHVISLSAHSEEVIQPNLNRTVKIHRLGNPVEVVRRPRVQAEHNRAITYIGRLAQEKGVLDLAKAVGNGFKGDWPVVFAGAGDLRPKLLQLAPGAIVTGWLDRSGVDEVLQRARVVVCPSVCHETYGLSAAEARARGVPVVVSDRCATREQVRDGIDGWHFRQGNPESLRTVLKQALNDPRLEQISRNAYEHYWSSPSELTGHLAQLEMIYAEVLGVQRRAAVA